MSTSQQKAKTRAMLYRIIRFVGGLFHKIVMSVLELTMLENTELIVSMLASWPY